MCGSYRLIGQHCNTIAQLPSALRLTRLVCGRLTSGSTNINCGKTNMNCDEIKIYCGKANINCGKTKTDCGKTKINCGRTIIQVKELLRTMVMFRLWRCHYKSARGLTHFHNHVLDLVNYLIRSKRHAHNLVSDHGIRSFPG